MSKYLVLLLSLTIISCGGDGTTSSTSSSIAAISSIDKAVNSMDIFDTSASKLSELDFMYEDKRACSAGEAKDPSTIDFHCSTYGSPLKSVNGDGDYCTYTSADTTYVAEMFYCSVLFNTVSPDSLRGVLTLANLIECSLTNEGYFTFSSGDENSGTITLDLTTSNSCFNNFTYTDPEPDDGASTDIASYVSNRLSSEAGESIPANVTVTRLSSGDWDHSVTFSVSAASFELTLKLKNSDDIVAASLADGDEAWTVVLNQSSGVMSFETIDTTNNRRRRTMVNGTFDSNGELDLTQDVSLKAWVLEQCTSSDSSSCDATGSDVGWSEFTSITGTYTASSNYSVFKQVQYTNNSGSFATTVDSVCPTGSAGDCSSITAITASESELDTLNSGTSAALTSMTNDHPLLNYTDVTTENIPWSSRL